MKREQKLFRVSGTSRLPNVHGKRFSIACLVYAGNSRGALGQARRILLGMTDLRAERVPLKGGA